jgi:VCBS repeat-containing protein
VFAQGGTASKEDQMFGTFVRVKQRVVLCGLVVALIVTGAAPLLGGHGADAKKGNDRDVSAEGGASPALVQQFANPTILRMRDNEPAVTSAIEVSGFTTPIADVDVQLLKVDFFDGSTQDIDVLLIGPDGKTALIMSDVGGNTATNNVNLLIDDQAPEQLPSNGELTNCICQPTNVGSPDTMNLGAGAVTVPSGASLGVFNGINPNGTWRLWAFDDANNAISGNISRGWTLKITSANGVPAAGSDSFQAQAGKTLTVPADGVLGNDTDPDGDTLQAIVAGQPKQGRLSLHADGSFTYTPKKKAKGTDSFTYLAQDPSGLNALATVDITIKAKKDKKGKGGKNGKK